MSNEKQPILVSLYGPDAPGTAANLVEYMNSLNAGLDAKAVSSPLDLAGPDHPIFSGATNTTEYAMQTQRAAEESSLISGGASVTDRPWRALVGNLAENSSVKPAELVKSVDAAGAHTRHRELSVWLGDPEPASGLSRAELESFGVETVDDIGGNLGDYVSQKVADLMVGASERRNLQRLAEKGRGNAEPVAKQAAPPAPEKTETEPSKEADVQPEPRWVTVQLPADSVSRVKLKSGRDMLKGTLPEGVSVGDTDLSGYSFLATESPKRAERLDAGEPVNFHFREDRPVRLSRYDREAKGVVRAEAEPWDLTMAVKRNRDERGQEAGHEQSRDDDARPHEPVPGAPKPEVTSEVRSSGDER